MEMCTSRPATNWQKPSQRRRAGKQEAQMRSLLIVVLLGLPAWSQVRVWEGTLTLPTYQEGQPDENPPFDVFATTKYSYPYTLRENLTDRRIDQTWRALYLENEFLKCVVLPDIGGHLYTCTD